jgi:hypothetical protein
MPSSDKRTIELPDFERDMPLDEAALEALDRARELPPLSFEQYLEFLNALTAGKPAPRDISGPSEPFTL